MELQDYLKKRKSELKTELYAYEFKQNDKSKPQHSRNLARECCIDLKARILELDLIIKKNKDGQIKIN